MNLAKQQWMDEGMDVIVLCQWGWTSVQILDENYNILGFSSLICLASVIQMCPQIMSRL